MAMRCAPVLLPCASTRSVVPCSICSCAVSHAFCERTGIYILKAARRLLGCMRWQQDGAQGTPIPGLPVLHVCMWSSTR